MPIGTLAEKSLHAALKQWYAQRDDQIEVPLEGYHIDIVRGNLLIEIQTRQFSAIKRKLQTLLKQHYVHLVHPIQVERWLLTYDANGNELSRRRSPKRANVYHIFNELLRFPDLMQEERFSLEVLLIRDEEIRINDGRGSWRRKGQSIVDRRLLEVIESRVFRTPLDLCMLLPELPDTFTTKSLASAIHQPVALAQRMAYCLRHMNMFEVVGKEGNAYLYRRINSG